MYGSKQACARFGVKYYVWEVNAFQMIGCWRVDRVHPTSVILNIHNLSKNDPSIKYKGFWILFN